MRDSIRRAAFAGLFLAGIAGPEARAQYPGGVVYAGYAPVGVPYAAPVYGYAPNPYAAAARQRGYQEGRYYYETGIAPPRPLSPAEARGFVAGEIRAANRPWQADPAKQVGFREGEYYARTGIAPQRPLSPAEAQGFVAGERRAAYAPYPIYGGYPVAPVYRPW